MYITIFISILTIIYIIGSVLFRSTIYYKGVKIGTYCVVSLLGAVSLIAFDRIDISSIWIGLTSQDAINPFKILALFISMTMFSIFIDEIGFFRYLANATIRRAKCNQFMLFLLLYSLVSVLTVFTSNDIVILTFTPFICYFAKNAKINPVPYLITEFVAANTWSMALIIGNPTNIYLATANNISFLDYTAVMAIPTILSGLSSFCLLFLLFRNQLKQKINPVLDEVKISNKPLLIIGLIHLIANTVCLIISSYIDIEMWLISVGFVCSLFVSVSLYCFIKRMRPAILRRTFLLAPREIFPFVISMFIMILALDNNGIIEQLSIFFGVENLILTYGAYSFLSANLINNIPMSVLFTSILTSLEGANLTKAVYSVIIGSNLGALLSPLGALAGVMWSNILYNHNVKFSFLSFVRYGAIISIPTLFVALISLYIVIRYLV